MKDEVKYQELMARYLAGEMTSREKAKFMSWVEESAEHQQFFEQMMDVWSVVEQDPIPDFGHNMDSAWNRIDEETITLNEPLKVIYNEPTTTKVVPLWRRHFAKIAIAASLILAIGVFWQNYINQSVEIPTTLVYQTGEEEQLNVSLPDGSEVVLNENTKLTYLPQGSKRAATLVGEAFFEIERDEDRPFEILSGSAKTVVLGTSFNVRAYPNEPTVEVSVASGKVAFVEAKTTAKPVFLEKGSRGVFNKKADSVQKETVATANANAWKTRQLVFNDEMMKEVIPTLERYFEVELELGNTKINQCSINGDFKQPQLDEVLQIISFTLDVNVEKRDDGRYVLSGNGCEF